MSLSLRLPHTMCRAIAGLVCCLSLLTMVTHVVEAKMPGMLGPRSEDLENVEQGGLKSFNKGDKAFFDASGTYKKGNKEEGSKLMLECALQGNFEALATLALFARLEELNKQPLSLHLPASFWEEWLIRMLGEAEGNYVLGYVLADWATVRNAAETLGKPSVDFLRKSANAGHPEAMFGLSMLAELYPDPAFVLPKKADFPILPPGIRNANDKDLVGLYWLGRAAQAGSLRANFVMGMGFSSTTNKSTNNLPLAENFFLRAIEEGSYTSIVMIQSMLDEMENASCKKEFYYSALRARVQFDNVIILDQFDTGTDQAFPGVVADQMRKGGNEWHPQPCLSDADYEAAVTESEVEYHRLYNLLQAKMEKQKTLYDKAKEQLPAFKKAYEQAVAGKVAQ